MSLLHFCCWGAARWKIASYVQMTKSTICQVDMPTFPKTMLLFVFTTCAYFHPLDCVSTWWLISIVFISLVVPQSHENCSLIAFRVYFPIITKILPIYVNITFHEFEVFSNSCTFEVFYSIAMLILLEVFKSSLLDIVISN